MAGDSIIYSASDLASAARCEYALLREFDAKLGRGQRLTVTDDLLERTAALGDDHEQRRLDQLRDEHYAHGSPVRWDDEQVRACFRCPVCEEQVRATDDLLLVAGMRVSQRATLLDAGITTVAELAERAGPVANVSARSLKALVG